MRRDACRRAGSGPGPGAPRSTWSWRHAGRQLAADRALEDHVDRVAEELRARGRRRHADDGEHDDDDDQRSLRAQVAEQPPERAPEVLAAWPAGRPIPMPIIPAAAGPATAGAAGAPGRPGRRRGAARAARAAAGAVAGRRAPLMRRPPPRTAASRRSRGRSRWSRAARRGCRCRRPGRRPGRRSGRLHDRADPLGDDDHRRVGRAPARAPPAGARRSPKSRAEKLSSKTKIGGPLDERPGDREALALAARHVRAALGDRRLEAALHLLDEVAALGDVERVPQLVVGRRRRRRSGGCWRRCR